MTDPLDRPTTLQTILETALSSFNRWQTQRDPEALRTSLHMWSVLLAELPAGSPHRPSCLTELGRALRGWFDLTGDVCALDRAVEVSAVAVAEGQALDDPFLSEQLSNLALALWTRFRAGGRLTDLDEGITAVRRSIATAPPGHESLPARRSNLSQMLMQRWEGAEAPADLAEALTVVREAVVDMDAGHSLAGVAHLNLSELLQLTYRDTHAASDLEESIEAAREAVRLSRPGDPVHAKAWGGLARRLLLRMQSAGRDGIESGTRVDTGIRTALEELVGAARNAVDLGDPDDPYGPLDLFCLASALHLRGTYTDVKEDLDEAITLYENLLAARRESPDRTRVVQDLAHALVLRHQWTNDARDIHSAVQHLRLAARDMPDSDPELPSVLLSQAIALSSLYDEHTAEAAELDEAADLVARAISLSAEGSDEISLLRASLGELLIRRFEDRGDAADLEAATAMSLRAVRDTPLGAGHRRPVTHAAVVVLRVRGLHTGVRADFDTAVALAREAAEDTGPGQHDRTLVLLDLGNALQARYEHGGVLDDLHRAIDAKRGAIPSGRLSATQRALCLSGLGHSLRTRFEVSGDVADLTAAVAACAEAVAAVKADHPYQDRLLANLSLALEASYLRHDRRSDLERAVVCARTAVGATPPRSHRLPMNLCNLAIITQHRFSESQDPGDLEAAITAIRKAIAVASDDHSDQVKFLSNLCRMLHVRYDLLGREEDLTESVNVGRLSVERCPRDHESRGRCLVILGESLNRAGLVAEAIDTFRQAARLSTGILHLRLAAARSWGVLAATQKEWEEALRGYAYAIELLPQAAWHGLERTDREHFLSTAQGLASDAAAVAIEQGRLARAVELLEQGRGVLLAQALDARTDLDELRALDPDLAGAMDGVRNRLDRAGDAGRDRETRNLSAHQVALDSQHRREAAAEWDRLLERARALVPDFLRPRPYHRLREAARGGPVVMVNVSRYRSDALVVTAGSALPRLIRLERISRPVVNGWARELISAFRGLEDTTAQDRNDTVRSLLASLWTDIVDPVLTALDWPSQPAEGAEPRLWWCPTGALTMLPLHAAGFCPAPGDEPNDDPLPAHTNLLDRAVCSYAPTLRALLEAGRRPAGATTEMLGVAVPNADGMAELRHAVPEVGSLREQFPTMTAVIGPQATRDTVLEQLVSHSWLHFAGHGSQYSLAGGALHCTDHVISLREVTALRLTAAELAFLSACDTAGGVASLADEFAHLAGGLHLAGFRHVIATQWSISDLRAPQVARDFYRALGTAPYSAGGTPDAAAALHVAVRRLRRSRPEAPALWAPYLHTGP
ncbi:CHAT domain-containing protein [Streptomyces sp. NPDC006430]|uniref:CHAT domain-containing protein n=1 Tax=Streptomyces sp. NPDC006430 TaxID=3154299 RepID=UPI0033A28603